MTTTGTILPFRGELPRISETAFVAPGSTVIGDVEMGDESSLWFNCVVRGDVNYIRVGPRTNIQDGTVVHVSGAEGYTTIGADVVIGHMCLIHGCVLEDACMVGMGATVMDGVVVETGAWVGAGSLVTPGKHVKAGEMWMGRPARPVRDVSEAELAEIARIALNYRNLAVDFMAALKDGAPTVGQ